MKIAFIHPMRTGGASLLDRARAAAIPIHCGWRHGLGRDWTRDELYAHAESSSGIAHAHVAAWDAEMLDIYHANGWTSLMTYREPLAQLMSLWRLSIKQGWIEPTTSLLEFVERHCQLRHGLPTAEARVWCIPMWWRDVNHLVECNADMLSRVAAIGIVKADVLDHDDRFIETQHDVPPEVRAIVDRSFAADVYRQMRATR
ncbi:MAG: hypothetical protein KGL39_16335 [Patescibacteria group bacterium]|nr:hypothetical protein [Patescibacteria group bacterium]